MTRLRIYAALLLLFPRLLGAQGAGYETAWAMPPEPPREFRGAWLATIGNIDWPSEPGLPVARQKVELLALLDRAVQLRLNAIIFQVRPSSDAFYNSALEPWSEYLMGHMGQPPEPFYDPLAFAVAAAHARGLELHAWFNPFRAQHRLAKSPPSPTHYARTHPEFVRRYGDELDLDPGEPAVRAHVLQVVLDVVNRYDVDGVQFDDYFYPYPVKDARGQEVDFPDLATWQKYGAPLGVDRATWRRKNINQFVLSIYAGIKATKPWVKFGISPFGIWRPYYPPSVRGFDAYAKLYADSRLWLASGWVDYLSPQLYWPVASPQQSFPALLQWWQAQNVLNRHVWPGLADYQTGAKFTSNEINQEITLTRGRPDPGEIHFHLRSVEENPALARELQMDYGKPALVPPSPWLDPAPPARPVLQLSAPAGGLRANWQPGYSSNGQSKSVRNWVLQFRSNGGWQTEILPGPQTSWNFAAPPPQTVVLRAVDRLGNLSSPASLNRGSQAHAVMTGAASVNLNH
jgi:uncharacterized lipoprotein YddW (UPF0748 family)